MIYLDNAATSFPKPPEVHRAVDFCAKEYAANAGRGAHRMSILAAERLWDTREKLAKLFDIERPEQIVFTKNCTEALNIGIKGVLKEGETLVISAMEHNSVRRPARALAESGIRLKVAPAEKDGTVTPEKIGDVLSPDVKMVLLQHASNVGGGVNPIGEIGALLKKRGILFMVDAAQTAGCVPISVREMHIDLLAFPGHKGLFGPQGTGGLYVDPAVSVRPLCEGGSGSASEEAFMPEMLPDRLEAGTLNLPGIAGLGAGAEYILAHGAEAIGMYEKALCRIFMEEISDINEVRILGPEIGKERVGVVSLALSGVDAAYAAERLDKDYDIAVRAGLHCAPLAAENFGILLGGSLRFSPGIFNTEAEIRYAARAIHEIMQKGIDAK